MHQAVRARVEEDVRVLGSAVSALETGADARVPAVQRALDELRQLRKRKEESLEGQPDPLLTTSQV
jgi:hypothetical protein